MIRSREFGQKIIPNDIISQIRLPQLTLPGWRQAVQALVTVPLLLDISMLKPEQVAGQTGYIVRITDTEGERFIRILEARKIPIGLDAQDSETSQLIQTHLASPFYDRFSVRTLNGNGNWTTLDEEENSGKDDHPILPKLICAGATGITLFGGPILLAGCNPPPSPVATYQQEIQQDQGDDGQAGDDSNRNFPKGDNLAPPNSTISTPSADSVLEAPDRDREEILSFATVLLGVPKEEVVIDEIAFPGYVLLKSNRNTQQAVFYNPTTDQFLKADLRGNLQRVTLETRQIRSSLKAALNLSDEEAAQWVTQSEVKLANGQVFPATSSRYIGINIRTALDKGIIRPNQIPGITNQVFNNLEIVARDTGVYNEDLGPGNVLLHITRNGEAKAVVIDWTNVFKVQKAGMEIPLSVKIKAFRKFFTALNLSGLSITEILGGIENIELQNVIINIIREPGYRRMLLKRMVKGGAVVVAVASFIMSADEARAAVIEQEQRGESFIFDLNAYNLLQAGLPQSMIQSALDKVGSGGNGLDEIGMIPLTAGLIDKMSSAAVPGEKKPLIIKNWMIDRTVQPFVPIITGLVGLKDDQGNFALYHEATMEKVDRETIQMITVGVAPDGTVGTEVWEAEVIANIGFVPPGKTQDQKITWPYVIILKKPILFLPN